MARARNSAKRKKTGAAARDLQSNLHLPQMLALSPAVLYTCGPGPDYPTVFISENVVSQLGYTPSEFYQDAYFWMKLLHPDDTDRILNALSRMGHEDRLSYEYRIRDRDGRFLWVHDQVSVVRDSTGEVSMLVGSWFDISQRKHAEAALLESLRLAQFGAKVRASLDQKRPIGEVLQHCAEAMVSHLNAALARIWTVRPSEEVLELRASAGLYTHTDGNHSRIRVGQLKIGLIAQQRKPHLTNSVIGDPRIDDQVWAKREGMVAFAGYPLVVEDRLIGVMAMFSRQPLTAAALGAMETVGGIMAMGIELRRTEEVLRRSERLASIGTLAAGMAHEINNPITAILLAAQNGLASRNKADGPTRIDECLDSIIKDAERCERIIKSVLQFSRHGSTRKWPNDITAIVRQSANLVQDYARQKQTSIALDLDPELPKVSVSPGQIEQVFVNLIRNAVESGTAGNQVCICTQRGLDGIRVLVSDRGSGLNGEQRLRMFDPFYTTRERQGGTGLGLSIVHGIVRSHGGSIDVEDRPGGGTTITVELPVAAADDRKDHTGSDMNPTF